MTPQPDSIRETVLSALCRVAPEIDPIEIDPSASMQEELDIDSMDYLNFVTALHEATGIDVPERDYPQLQTVDQCVAYLSAHRLASDVA